MTEEEKDVSIQRLLAFGFKPHRTNPESILYYHEDIEINFNYLMTPYSQKWYVDIVISFPSNLQMMFTDIFLENDIDPEAVIDSVKKLAAAVKFIEL